MAASDVVSLLLELLVQTGGRLAGSQCVQAIKKKDPALRRHIEDAGGLKRFCAQHDALEFITVAGSDGYVKRRASPQVVVTEMVLSLIDENGGSFAGSQAVPALRQRDEAFKKIVDDAGGLKKFCMGQAELEFVTEAGNGGFLRRAKSASANVLNLALVVQPPAKVSNLAVTAAVSVASLQELLARTPSTSASSGVSSLSAASASECSSDDEASHLRGSLVGRMVANATRCNLGNTHTMYHATTRSGAVSIMHSGLFLPGRGGYLGPGIYFSRDPAAALHRAQPNSKGPLVVLGFEVQMGRMQTLARKIPWTEEVQLEAGFHSMKACGKGNDCYMIPDFSQAQIDMTTLREHEL